MIRLNLVAIGVLSLALHAGAGVVRLSLESPASGKVVPPSAQIAWSIRVQVSDDNAGLALASVDLLQNAANPALFDIPAASSVPSEMINFSRPAGISNPGVDGIADGYLGTPLGDAGARNLAQLGGGQNTFGEAGDEFGQNATVVGGVGQGAGQLLAAGEFAAPATAGVYEFSLANGIATVLEQINEPPLPSVVSIATVELTNSLITLTVAGRGDLNCDGGVDFGDVDAFVTALTGESNYAAEYPACSSSLGDFDQSGVVDFADIDAFVECLINGGC